MSLRPFFCYYGGKWRAAPKYPLPEYDLIVEPFAGAAGYATRYANRRVLLVEKDPIIAGLWKYLIKVSASEVRSLPLLGNDQTVDDLHGVAQEAKWLVGFWLNKGSNGPRRSPSSWMRQGIRPKSYWGEHVRALLASQVDQIRHWECWEGSYDTAPRTVATWFVDPPYQLAGQHYVHGSKDLEYGRLAAWCRDRWGQTIVCENSGATWLPFVPFAAIKSSESSRGKSKSLEAIWTRSVTPVVASEVA